VWVQLTEVVMNRVVTWSPCVVDGVNRGAGDELTRLAARGACALDDAVVGKATSAPTSFSEAFEDSCGLAKDALEAVRRQAEAADTLQGFQVVHGIGGATGSGTACKLLYALKEEFPHKMTLTFPVVPSFAVRSRWPAVACMDVGGRGATLKCATCLLQEADARHASMLNAGCSIPHLVEDVDVCVVLDTDSMERLQRRHAHTTFACGDSAAKAGGGGGGGGGGVHHLMASAMSDATCTLRFPTMRSKDLRQVGVNLVPFPRSHFLCQSYATPAALRNLRVEATATDAHGALGAAGSDASGAVPTPSPHSAAEQCVVRLFNPHNATCTPSDDFDKAPLQILTACALLRGSCAPRHASQAERVLRAVEKLGRSGGGANALLVRNEVGEWDPPAATAFGGEMVCPPRHICGGEFQPDGIMLNTCTVPRCGRQRAREVARGVRVGGGAIAGAGAGGGAGAGADASAGPPRQRTCSCSASLLMNSLVMAEEFAKLGQWFTQARRDTAVAARSVGCGRGDGTLTPTLCFGGREPRHGCHWIRLLTHSTFGSMLPLQVSSAWCG